MLLTPTMRARLADLHPWLRKAARNNRVARAVMIRHVREGLPLMAALGELRAYLLSRGAQNLGWPETPDARVDVLREMCLWG